MNIKITGQTNVSATLSGPHLHFDSGIKMPSEQECLVTREDGSTFIVCIPVPPPEVKIDKLKAKHE